MSTKLTVHFVNINSYLKKISSLNSRFKSRVNSRFTSSAVLIFFRATLFFILLLLKRVDVYNFISKKESILISFTYLEKIMHKESITLSCKHFSYSLSQESTVC